MNLEPSHIFNVQAVKPRLRPEILKTAQWNVPLKIIKRFRQSNKKTNLDFGFECWEFQHF